MNRRKVLRKSRNQQHQLGMGSQRRKINCLMECDIGGLAVYLQYLTTSLDTFRSIS